MTVAEALEFGKGKIERRDAVLLLCHITGQNSGYIMLNGHETMDMKAENLYQEYLRRRQTGEPLQYILGSWDFMGQTLNVDRRALIPRPETELMVEKSFEFIRGCELPDIRMLDLCTGSGCIAVAIASMAKAAGIGISIIATDISPAALELAKENSVANGFGNVIRFINSDLFDGEEFRNLKGKFDIIISNPPYIPSEEIATLEPVVRDFEPHIALDGGIDGMDIYRRIVPQSFEFLRSGGALTLEIGPVAVEEMLINTNFSDVQLIRDYAGLPRILHGIRP